MTGPNPFCVEIAKSGYYCSQYPGSDDRFSSLIPHGLRFLCCLPSAMNGQRLSPTGLALIVYPGTWCSIVFTLGGRSYLCPLNMHLPGLVIDALSASTEEPTAMIQTSVLEKHHAQEIDVFSIFSHTSLTDLQAAIDESVPFAPKTLLLDVRCNTSIDVSECGNGVIEFRHGEARAVAFIQNHEQPVMRLQLAVFGIPQQSKDSLDLFRYLLNSNHWSIYHDIWGGQLDLDDPFYQFAPLGCAVDAPLYCL